MGSTGTSAAMARALFLSAAALALLLAACSGELQRFEHAAKGDGSLDVLVVGDWGRRGLYNQSRVASQMGKIGEQMNIDFVISTGDNFYEDGLIGINDTMFEESFTNVYTAKSLQTQWYTVLGNHDYRGDAVAQLSPVFQKIDGRWLCLRSFIVNAEFVDFFFVDTSPFVLEYWNDPGEHRYDWRGVHPRKSYVSNLLMDLDLELKQSAASWKIVVGHHTMRSVSEHGDTLELLESLLPILKANGVSMYINGHDHCLEHISSNDSPIQYFTSGAGSKAWRGIFTPNADNLRFFYDGQGFMSLHLTRTIADLVFYDVSGTVLYSWSMPKDEHSAV